MGETVATHGSFIYLAASEHHFNASAEDVRLRNEVFGDQLARRPWPGWRSASFLRIYTDLDTGTVSPIHAQGVAHSFIELLTDASETVSFQNNAPSFLRRILARETREEGIDVVSPQIAALGRPSPMWRKLIEWLDGWDDLDELKRIRVARLVNRMGFYKFNYEFLTEERVSRVRDQTLRSDLVSLRGVAAFKCGLSLASVEHQLAESAAIGSGIPAVRAAAEIYLAVHHAKISKNRDELARWASLARQTFLEYIQTSAGANDTLFRSIFFRGFAYVPFLNKDGTRATSMLDEAENAAHEAVASTAINTIASRENLFAVTETRIQEARALGERELAVDRSRQLVELDPLDPRSHIHLGETLLEQAGSEAALGAFLKAASVGAPHTPRALSLAANCWERMGEKQEALEYHVAALDIEPCAVMTLFRVHKLAKELSHIQLREWSGRRLNALRTKVRA
jgi:tetratricopeptide (TPR) repeat protein